MVYIDLGASRLISSISAKLNTGNSMELTNIIREVRDDGNAIKDVLKIRLRPLESPKGMHEVRFVRASTNSRDTKEISFYLDAEDMFELEAAVRVYNRGLVE